MDLLSQHEAFLRAIFDAPEDDTPRLVYADFLQEQGREPIAALIRWQCGRGERPDWWTRDSPDGNGMYDRGFHRMMCDCVGLPIDRLRDVASLRYGLVHHAPEHFSATQLRLMGGRITSAEPFDVLFSLVAFARVADLNLSGEEVPDESDREGAFTIFHLEPVITTSGVTALAQHRGLRRITALNLTNNDLDNDAARALVNSPYLDNLKRLQLLEGNRFRGRVWQQVIERFGEDVVG